MTLTIRTYYNASTLGCLVHDNLTNAKYRTIGFSNQVNLPSPFKRFSDSYVVSGQCASTGKLLCGERTSKDEGYCSMDAFLVPNFTNTRRKI